jgi:hypothetical protein
MNQTNADLDRWRLLWQARTEGPDAADLRDRVARETRRRRALMAAPVSVTVAIGGAMIAWAIASPGVESIALAIESWLFIAIVWAGAIWIDRGTWTPLGNTTAAFIDISIRRCRSDIAGLRFGVILYLVQFVAILVMKYYVSSLGLLELVTAWPVVVVGWIGFPVLLVFAFWYGRRKASQLRQLLALRHQLTED